MGDLGKVAHFFIYFVTTEHRFTSNPQTVRFLGSTTLVNAD
ncbi:hypothetical protein HK44_018745 [Pseudomonas fluorescens HK44]|uniref:Uncharacterized protein n=1 Tax=Pseudomonas fluorescens HK44 TaxID=1042209 RepID=A0A010SJJ9_PSEFL|nr:hypothetical protein HK44_018745 [Pseudomonas fluorescens HK44]